MVNSQNVLPNSENDFFDLITDPQVREYMRDYLQKREEARKRDETRGLVREGLNVPSRFAEAMANAYRTAGRMPATSFAEPRTGRKSEAERLDEDLKRRAELLQAGRGLSNVAALQDPNSPESRMYQDVILQMLPNLSEEMKERIRTEGSVDRLAPLLPAASKLIPKETKPGRFDATLEQTEALRDALRPAAEKAGIDVDDPRLGYRELYDLRSVLTTTAGQEKTQERFGKTRESVLNSYEQGLVDRSITRYTSRTKKINDALDNATDADQLLLLADGNPIAPNAAKRKVARLAGEVGVLTDQDVAAFGGSKALAERLAQIAKEHYDGTMTENNRKWLMDVVNVMKRNAERRRRELAWEEAGRLSQARNKEGNTFLTQEQAYGRLLPGEEIPTFEETTSESKQQTEDELSRYERW